MGPIKGIQTRNYRLSRYGSTLFLPFLLISTTARSATYFVSPGGHSIPPYASWSDASTTIQAAIDVSATGDTIAVDSGVYLGDGNRDLDFAGRNVALLAVAGPEQTIIDCQGAETEPHRGAYFHTGEGSNAILSGFTIMSGMAPGDPWLGLSNGGGILCDSSSPTIVNCILRNNVAMNAGGGLACMNGASPTVIRCHLENNSAGRNQLTGLAGYGGALRCFSSSPTLTACTFVNNKANLGGAMSCNQSDLKADSCEFRENRAVMFWVIDPIINGFGGAIHLFQSTPEIISSTFVANTAEAEDMMSYLPGQGGAIYMYFANASISNCTFYGNCAQRAPGLSSGEGGSMLVAESSPTIERCIIAGSTDGEAVYCYDNASLPTIQCSDLIDNAGGDWVGCLSDQAQINGNFSLDPLFCSVSDPDLSLQDDSPCLGTNTQCGVLVGALGVGCTGSDVGSEGSTTRPEVSFLRNYPNPFNSSTIISFQVEGQSHVRLEVFDVLGRRQAVLVNEVMQSGSKSVRWDGRSAAGKVLPSGVYFCRLLTKQSAERVQLVLLR